MSLSELITPDYPIQERTYRIGAIGAGFIMADVQLAAYDKAGFDVVAIASRTAENASAVAKRWSIPTTNAGVAELLSNKSVEIVDVAMPPHTQLDIVRQAVKQPHIKGLLLQKPVAQSLQDAKTIVELCRQAGKVISISQNMRFDQSMRVLKQAIDSDWLGPIVTANIEMSAIPHWQPFLQGYRSLTLWNMSIHHLDVLRFLLGEVRKVYTAVRQDPRTEFYHFDGICHSTLEFETGALATSFEDVWASPSDDCPSGSYVRWRIVGEKGIAKGQIGWPDYPDGSPSTISICAPITNMQWETPTWQTQWFPDAFAGVMGQLQDAIASKREPELSGDDNLRTIALLEAAYRSAREGRAIYPERI